MLEVDCLLGEDWLLVKIHEWFTYPTGDLSVHLFQSSLSDHISKLFCLGDGDKDPPCHTLLMWSTHWLPNQINYISIQSDHLHIPISEPSWYSQLDFHVHLSWHSSIIALLLGLKLPYQYEPSQSGPICPPVHSLDLVPRYPLLLCLIHRTTCPDPPPLSTQQGSLHWLLCSNNHLTAQTPRLLICLLGITRGERNKRVHRPENV